MNDSVWVPATLWFVVSAHVVDPGGVVLIRQAVDLHTADPGGANVTTVTVALMVAPGATVTLDPPLSVTLVIKRSSVNVPPCDTPEVWPVAV